MMAGITLKNTIKKIYGSQTFTHYDEKQKQSSQVDAGELLAEDDPSNKIDDEGRKYLQEKIVEVLM